MPEFQRPALVIQIWFGVASLLLGGEVSAPSKPESYYRPSLSYGTTRDPDVPKYAKPASETIFPTADWLDLGLDARFRFEYRDDDLRRAVDGLDTPLLQRTRAYLGIHDILDPFRFAFEIQDARRYFGDFPRDNRDFNEAAVIRLQAELYFKDALGVDDLGNPRPLMFRYGIQNFEFLDRRLLGNNQWRNTANTFLGFRGALGQESNDWQVDLLAVQPLERNISEWDEPSDGQWLYGAIGHWRGWSEFVTIEPYYLALDQEQTSVATNRTVHSPGLRAYGQFGDSGFDFDFTGTKQFGENGRQEIDAWAATGEIGYCFDHDWEPRVSFFYGFASGDKDPTDGEDNRFERFFGFGRPWSANDYIIFENIKTPKLRVELAPLDNLRVDFGYSWFDLASSRDRFNNGGNRLVDPTGNSGDGIGREFDIRARHQLSKKVEAILGYTHLESGDFILNTQGREDTDFAYLELNLSLF